MSLDKTADAIQETMQGISILEKSIAKKNAASIPLVITKEKMQQILDLGYSRAFINKLTPQEAEDIISKGVTKDQGTIPATETTAENTEETKEPGINQEKDITHDTEPEKEKEIPVQEKKPEPEIKADGRKNITLFDQAEIPTNEDKGIQKSIETLVAEKEIESAEITEDNPELRKQQNIAKAGMVVELCDVGFMLLCCLISYDFSKENQAFYTLHPERKKAIKINLILIYNLDTKVRDPRKTIAGLITMSYAPMLVLSCFALAARLKKRQEDKEKEEQKLIANTAFEIEKMNMQAEINKQKLELERIKLLKDEKSIEQEIEESLNKDLIEKEPNPNLRPEKKVIENVGNGGAREGAGRHRKDCVCSKCTAKKLEAAKLLKKKNKK